MSDHPRTPFSSDSPDVLHHFVDEAGDPTLFNHKGTLIVETLGCSRFFMLGVLEVDAPDQLAAALTGLRTRMLADPYFAGVESFKPTRQKTAHLFHAKDDLPEVRREVFQLLRQQGPSIRFHAVVGDKLAIAQAERSKRVAASAYRYRPDSLYDALTGELFSGLHRFADEHRLCVAKRGSKDRNDAIRTALAEADAAFESRFGYRRKGQWVVEVSDPTRRVCLQAADYFYGPYNDFSRYASTAAPNSQWWTKRPGHRCVKIVSSTHFGPKSRKSTTCTSGKHRVSVGLMHARSTWWSGSRA